MSKFVDIEIDRGSVKRFEKSSKRYGKESAKALLRAIMRTAFAVESDAKRRLQGQLGSARHWVTGRLASSVHVEAKGENTFEGVKDSEAKDGKLNVSVKELEAVVGTNVEYAQKIEFDYDSFIMFGYNRQAKNLPKRVQEEWNKLDKKFNG